MQKQMYSISSPDQQRLKVARAEIEAILKKHDLAAVVVLHTPGMTEFFYDVCPSYSCAWLDERQSAVRVKSLLSDYGGSVAIQLHDQSATANLFNGIADSLSGAAGMFVHVARVIDMQLKATHTQSMFIADPAELSRH